MWGKINTKGKVSLFLVLLISGFVTISFRSLFIFGKWGKGVFLNFRRTYPLDSVNIWKDGTLPFEILLILPFQIPTKSVNIWYPKCMFEWTMCWWWFYKGKRPNSFLNFAQACGSFCNRLSLTMLTDCLGMHNWSDYKEKGVAFIICKISKWPYIHKFTP